MRYNFLIIFLIFKLASAQWSNDPSKNLQVTDWGRNHRVASDGNGGVYIGAGRIVSDISHCLYLLRLDKDGYKSWPDTIRILGEFETQGELRLLASDNGSIIAGFIDQKYIGFNGHSNDYSYTIKVQKVDTLGNLFWGETGVQVSLDTLDQYDYEITMDENGGCFVSWTADPLFGDVDKKGIKSIQHISGSGERLWGDTGIILYTGDVQYEPFKIVYDKLGGVFVDYDDDNKTAIYRMNNAGEIDWEKEKRITFGTMIPDSLGGLILAGFNWQDNNTRKEFAIDRFNNLGEYSWENPVVIADSVGNASEVIDIYITSDSSIIFFWMNFFHPSGPYNSYIQKLGKDRNILFPGLGYTPSSVQDSSIWGEAMIKSEDYIIPIFIRNGGYYAQKISTNGLYIWENDILISTRASTVRNAIPDNNNGFISVWREDIYGIWAQKVLSTGLLADIPVSIKKIHELPSNYSLNIKTYPNPFNAAVQIDYSLTNNSQIKISVFDMKGGLIKTLIHSQQKQGEYKLHWDRTNLSGNPVSSGIYFIQLKVVTGLNSQTVSQKITLLK